MLQPLSGDVATVFAGCCNRCPRMLQLLSGVVATIVLGCCMPSGFAILFILKSLMVLTHISYNCDVYMYMYVQFLMCIIHMSLCLVHHIHAHFNGRTVVLHLVVDTEGPYGWELSPNI